MILRMATLEDDLLSYTNMGVFGKDGFKSEQVYNQGYAFLNYLAETYGQDSVRAMSRHRPIVNFKSAVKKSTGRSAPELYDEWTVHLDRKYGALADSIRASGEREANCSRIGETWNTSPRTHPTARKWLSSATREATTLSWKCS